MFLRFVLACGCVAAACVLAAQDRDGWGWFLFVGFLVAPIGGGAGPGGADE